MQIIQKRRYLFAVSAVLLIASIAALSLWRLNLGIDFTGGVLAEVKFNQDDPGKEAIENDLRKLNLTGMLVQPSEDGAYIIRYQAKGDEINEQVQNKINEKYENPEFLRTEFISSVISDELKTKAIYAVGIAVLGVAFYISWAFRRISYPIKSWKYGVGAVLALFHDILITLGIFAFLGHFYNVEVGIPFVAALLTILGYSVNDTIVIFDRVRENLMKAGAAKDFEETVNKSAKESIARSVNTSLTVMLVLLAIIFFGGETIKFFSLALLIGVFFGTYSSIFVATAFVTELWSRTYKHENI
ncbi:MAG: protein translocase subunit SecF [Candidatus Moranbacteria bacterium]|nr:protein translocase subunit SecF [Candidatus Moranbacteria bacterium]